MSHSGSLNLPLLSRGMMSVLIAQFLSALADNAILIAAIAIVKQQGLENLVPVLQESFLVPFILLAPFVGYLADRLPKGRVMLIGNSVKFIGALLMCLGVNPFTAYGVIGVGAAMYSPAKYGILSQLFSAEKLVRANGMMEGATIVAILLGVLLGGFLADHSLNTAFWGVLIAYGTASLINLLIPKVPAEKSEIPFAPVQLTKQFFSNLTIMLKHRDTRFSLIGTSVFWGSGTTLRLILFAWVPAALLITDNQTPANLMGAVSIGIVIGAGLAGALINLKNVNRALWGGLLLGPAILVMPLVHDLYVAMACMMVIGLCGGLFVVPLNALLQERGHQSVGAGNALAVQNFFENFTMLLFVGLYSITKGVLSVNSTIVGFALIIFVVMMVLGLARRSPEFHT